MSALTAVLDFLFPPKCPFCGKVLSRPSEEVCPDCRKDLPYTGPEKRKADFVSSVTAPLYYEGVVRASILRFKFHGAPARGRVYGRMIARKLREEERSFDVITWVPLSRKRLRRRGYDQAGILAEAAAEELGTEAEPLLEKIREIPPQSGIRTPEARRANVSGCYRVIDPNPVRGKRVLLIDDVVTTGATVSECARMLMLAGAEEVLAAAVATPRKNKEKSQ